MRVSTTSVRKQRGYASDRSLTLPQHFLHPSSLVLGSLVKRPQLSKQNPQPLLFSLTFNKLWYKPSPFPFASIMIICCLMNFPAPGIDFAAASPVASSQNMRSCIGICHIVSVAVIIQNHETYSFILIVIHDSFLGRPLLQVADISVALPKLLALFPLSRIPLRWHITSLLLHLRKEPSKGNDTRRCTSVNAIRHGSAF